MTLQLDPDLLSRSATLDLKARRIVDGFLSGLHKSPHHGFSVEFAEHRAYQPGDELRHLDWKLYGKTERYFVKRYTEETNLRAHLFLDVSSSMHFHHFADWSKLRYGIHLFAALLHLLHRQRDAFGLITFDREIRNLWPANNARSHLNRLMDEMEKLLDNEERMSRERRATATAEALNEMAPRLGRRSLVVVAGDLFDDVDGHSELLSALRRLRYHRHEVILFHLIEKRSERDFAFPSGEFRFRDMETGELLTASPTLLRERYREEVEGHLESFRNACGNAGIEFEEMDTEGPFDRALLSWLKSRNRIR